MKKNLSILKKLKKYNLIRTIGVFSLSVILVLSQFSCSTPENNDQNLPYYDWANYLKSEISYLSTQSKMVHKSILLGNKKEDKVIKSMNWENEWAVFLEADINKPAYKLSYDNLSEDGLVWYSSKIGEKVPVKTFKMQVDIIGKPMQVEIEIIQSNFLFETRKKLNMNVVDGHVETYSIEGFQKIRYLPATTYKLMGVIL
jgi:hypothetical protein